MKKKIPPCLHYEEEDDKFAYDLMELGELQDVISNMEDNEPKDKRKKDHADWKVKLNEVIETYNVKAISKIYTKLK